MLLTGFPKWLRLAGTASLVLLASLSGDGDVLAQEEPAAVNQSNHAGSFSELLDKRRALLVVFKSRVISVDNRDRAIIEDVLKADPRPTGRYRWVYSQLASKLNKYIHKYQSLSSAAVWVEGEEFGVDFVRLLQSGSAGHFHGRRAARRAAGADEPR